MHTTMPIGTKRREPSLSEQKLSHHTRVTCRSRAQSHTPMVGFFGQGGVGLGGHHRSRPWAAPRGSMPRHTFDDRVSSEALCGTAQNFFCREEAAATAAGPGNPLTPRSWVPVVRRRSLFWGRGPGPEDLPRQSPIGSFGGQRCFGVDLEPHEALGGD